MRLVFGKYGALLILGVIVQTAVTVALLAQTLGLINPLVERCSNLIADWEPAPSATAIVAAVAAAVVAARTLRLVICFVTFETSAYGNLNKEHHLST